MYYLGLDIGSSSVKVAVVDASTGKNIASLHEPENEMEIQSLKNNCQALKKDCYLRGIHLKKNDNPMVSIT